MMCFLQFGFELKKKKPFYFEVELRANFFFFSLRFRFSIFRNVNGMRGKG